MEIKVASYNIHKAVGLDRRRDPERIMAVLREIDADVIALQEVDRRFGTRESVQPRGAVRADVLSGETRLRIAGLHLDLSGIRRRQQVHAVLQHLDTCDGDCPTVLMGDLNEWARHYGSLRAFGPDWRVLSPGHSFPARRPIAGLDRVIVSKHWDVVDAGVHHSALAARASDHLPVFARLTLPKK